MSYKKLEIWKLAFNSAVEIHAMTLTLFPKFEMFESGNQIRRSSKSTVANIVEGYGRRCYKQDFLRFLTYANTSNMETINHIEMLYCTGSLCDEEVYGNIIQKLTILGKRLTRFTQSVERNHICKK